MSVTEMIQRTSTSGQVQQHRRRRRRRVSVVTVMMRSGGEFTATITALMTCLLMISTIVVLTASAVNAITVTAETWENMTEGKQVFVEFMAPWCGHCKKIKPEWDRLQREYANHDSIFIAEFDCTTRSGEPFCKDLNIKGFPTFMSGSPDNLKLYGGKRDYGSLKSHIQLELNFPCRPEKLDLCTSKQKDLLHEFMQLDDDELDEKIDEAFGALIDVEEEFDVQKKELDQARMKLRRDYDETMKTLKEKIDWMQKILWSNKEDSKKDEL